MNCRALSRLNQFVGITSQILDGLLRGQTAMCIMNARVNQIGLMESCVKWGSSQYLFHPDDELTEITTLFSNGEGVLGWIQSVLEEFNARGIHPPLVELSPFTMEYTDCENWKVSFGDFVFAMIEGDLKITKTRLVSGAQVTGLEVYTVVSGWVYCQKNSYSYHQWAQFAANKMENLRG